MIFHNTLGTLDGLDTKRAVLTLANYVRSLQEQLEYTLTTLDSDNVIEIDTGRTSVGSSDGSTATGESVLLKGKGSSAFSVSKLTDGSLVFRMKANDGSDIFAANSASATFDVRKRASLSLDGGSWPKKNQEETEG